MQLPQIVFQGTGFVSVYDVDMDWSGLAIDNLHLHKRYVHHLGGGM
jgi:hypothetical protein